jgi:hypothetical protein
LRTTPSITPWAALPLIPVGRPVNDQIRPPIAFLAMKAILIDWPTLKIKFYGYSMTNPTFVWVDWTINYLFL